MCSAFKLTPGVRFRKTECKTLEGGTVPQPENDTPPPLEICSKKMKNNPEIASKNETVSPLRPTQTEGATISLGELGKFVCGTHACPIAGLSGLTPGAGGGRGGLPMGVDQPPCGVPKREFYLIDVRYSHAPVKQAAFGVLVRYVIFFPFR